MSFINPLDALFEKMFRSKTDPIEELFKGDYYNEKIEDLDTKIELSFKESYNGIQFPINIKGLLSKDAQKYMKMKKYI